MRSRRIVNERITSIFKPAASQDAIWACENSGSDPTALPHLQPSHCKGNPRRPVLFSVEAKVHTPRKVVLRRFVCRRRKDAFWRLKRLDKRANVSNLKCTYVTSRDIPNACAALSTRRLAPLVLDNREKLARCLSTEKPGHLAPSLLSTTTQATGELALASGVEWRNERERLSLHRSRYFVLFGTALAPRYRIN